MRRRPLPSGLASLVLAVIPLYVALTEMLLPGGEPLPARGWLGMALGFAGLAVLVWPSLRNGLGGDSTRLLAVGALLGGGVCWTAGSILVAPREAPRQQLCGRGLADAGRRRLQHCAGHGAGRNGRNSISTQPRSARWLGSSPEARCWATPASSICIEHVPVAKVSSYAYVNPMVAVLLGIPLLHERPGDTEFAGMAAIVVAVFLLTSAQVKARPRPIEELEQLPAD